jgi:hypothetical protein
MFTVASIDFRTQEEQNWAGEVVSLGFGACPSENGKYKYVLEKQPCIFMT